MIEDAPTELFDWSTLVRPEWSADDGISVRCYQVLLADPAGFKPNPKLIDLDSARVAIYFGKVRYLDSTEPLRVRARPRRAEDGSGTPEAVVDTIVPELQPIVVGPAFFALVAVAGASPAASSDTRLEEAVGLIAAVEDGGLLLDRVFEIGVWPQRNEFRSGVQRFLMRSTEPANVSDGRLARLPAVDSAIQKQPEAARNRILLSLRWLEATYSYAGSMRNTDLFLTYWVALEALAMPVERKKLRPLNRALARVYGSDAASAGTDFRTGKLYGIRKRIVHQGKRVLVGDAVVLYLEALYADVLFDLLGLPSDHRAQQLLRGDPKVASQIDDALS